MTRRSASLWASLAWATVALPAFFSSGCSGKVEHRTAAQGCTTLGGEHFDVGESVPSDGCSTCTCTEQGLACTQRACGTGGSGTGGTGGAVTCAYEGAIYGAGQSFPAADGCNKCTCSEDGSVYCTEMACPQGCNYGGVPYGVGEQFPAGDGCNTCTCQAGGSVSCGFAFCPTGCTWDGHTYPVGASFREPGGCNTCTCYEGGQVGCTTIACQCNPQNEWYRSYVATSPEGCESIRYTCPENTIGFSNDCGCGCEQDVSCPQSFDCMPPAPCDPVELRRKCPYSQIAL